MTPTPTLKLWLFGFFKVPLLWLAKPSVIKITDDECIIKIPFRRTNKNHVRSMYFGSLSIGADVCVGLLGMHHAERAGKKIAPVFKSFQADFKKMARGHTHFVCSEGQKVKTAMAQAIATGERQNVPISGYAVVPSIDPNEIVMTFTMELSVKVLD